MSSPFDSGEPTVHDHVVRPGAKDQALVAAPYFRR